jgi:hypothetical protein
MTPLFAAMNMIPNQMVLKKSDRRLLMMMAQRGSIKITTLRMNLPK